MAKLSLLAGTTSKTVKVFVQNNSVTTGAGLTGLAFGTSGLTAYYIREGAGSTTQIVLVTATLGTFTSSGFIVVDATNMPGVYELGIPNAAIAAGAKSVIIYLQGATNMAPVVLEIELTAVDNQSTGFGLVNASANAVQINGVSTSSVTTINANQGTTQPLNFTGTGASALVKSDMIDIASAAVSATTAQIGANIVNIAGTATAGAAGYVGIDWANVLNKTSTVALTATTISTGQTITSVSGSVGSVTGAVGSVTGAVGSVTGAVGSVTGAVGSVTGNVGGNVVGTVGSVVGAVGSVTAGVTVTTNNDKTGYALSSTGNNSVATAVFTNTLTEAYPTLGAAFTLAQGMYSLHQMYAQQSITSTTMTVLKRDQATSAKTFTLNSATTPTSITEAS